MLSVRDERSWWQGVWKNMARNNGSRRWQAKEFGGEGGEKWIRGDEIYRPGSNQHLQTQLKLSISFFSQKN